MVAKAHASLSPAMQRATVFTFPVNSSSRGYHIYQSIWPNPLRDDELADVQMGSRSEILSQRVLTLNSGTNSSKVSSIFITWWYKLAFISSSSYSMCSCDNLK